MAVAEEPIRFVRADRECCSGNGRSPAPRRTGPPGLASEASTTRLCSVRLCRSRFRLCAPPREVGRRPRWRWRARSDRRASAAGADREELPSGRGAARPAPPPPGARRARAGRESGSASRQRRESPGGLRHGGLGAGRAPRSPAQPSLPPRHERQLLDPTRLGPDPAAGGEPAWRRAGRREPAPSLVRGQDQRPGAQAVAGAVPGRAGLALGGDRAALEGAVAAGEIGLSRSAGQRRRRQSREHRSPVRAWWHRHPA